MEWLNYHHVYYFWLVAKEQSVTKAASILKVSQPTVSAQLKNLEDFLGEKLFDRVGKKIFLTDQGKITFRFADEIFSLGKEMLQTLRGQSVSRPVKFSIGIAEVIPKLIVHQLLQPIFALDKNYEIHCFEGAPEKLLMDLSFFNLDLVILDTEAPAMLKNKFHSHLFGSSSISCFAGKKLTQSLKKQAFPKCLNEAPMLLPTKHSTIRQELEAWLFKQKIKAKLVGEFQDTALMKVFGQDSIGFFFGPSVIEKDICRQYKVEVLGRIHSIKEKFFAISAKRKIIHPASLAVTTHAQKKLFRS